VKIRVWAPRAGAVDLVTEEASAPMHDVGRGWWEIDLEVAEPYIEYKFSLDGSKPLPDPRSPWQPEGIDGPSRTVDHSAFQWTDRHWRSRPLSSSLIYEIHIGTFTDQGTFEAAIDKLDYLARLGVTHIEIMPVGEFPGERGWGYDGVYMFSPHHAYGGPRGLKLLVDACHSKGLGVILDVVYNHFGPEGNHLERFGPYLTDSHMTSWGKAVNFDGPGSDTVRRFFLDNALMWLRDYHIDGIRIDAVHTIVDTSAIHILEELSDEVHALQAISGRSMFLIAESDLNNPMVVKSKEAGGYGINAQWSGDFHHALHAILTGERDGYYKDFGTIADLAKVMEKVFAYDGRYSEYRGRRHGRPVGALTGDHFICFLQNHDQVGNRAHGARIASLAGLRKSMVGAALLFTSPFLPLIFQGEEWAASSPFNFFTDYQDPKLGEAVRSGRLEEFERFGWDPWDIADPQSSETFERSKIDWSEIDRTPHSRMLEWYQALIRLRNAVPDLADGRVGRVKTYFDEAARWLVMERGMVTVACNFSTEARAVGLRGGRPAEVLLTSDQEIEISQGRFLLPPESVAIVGPSEFHAAVL
jgi:maltooligosyltrehalose trehalohydrolase